MWFFTKDVTTKFWLWSLEKAAVFGAVFYMLTYEVDIPIYPYDYEFRIENLGNDRKLVDGIVKELGHKKNVKILLVSCSPSKIGYVLYDKLKDDHMVVYAIGNRCDADMRTHARI